jgi:hypothetical protein
MSRLKALIVGGGFALATLEPALRALPFDQDSFPLSTYPMFARTLDKRVIVFAEGVGKASRVVRLGPELVANDEPMQAQRTLRRAASDGRPALRKLCARIAERAAAAHELAEIRRIRIVRGAFEPLRYFEVDAAPQDREVLEQCRVRRRP